MVLFKWMWWLISVIRGVFCWIRRDSLSVLILWFILCLGCLVVWDLFFWVIWWVVLLIKLFVMVVWCVWFLAFFSFSTARSISSVSAACWCLMFVWVVLLCVLVFVVLCVMNLVVLFLVILLLSLWVSKFKILAIYIVFSISFSSAKSSTWCFCEVLIKFLFVLFLMMLRIWNFWLCLWLLFWCVLRSF